MPPLDDVAAKSGSKALDRALSLIAAFACRCNRHCCEILIRRLATTFGNDFRARALEKVSTPDTDYPTASGSPRLRPFLCLKSGPAGLFRVRFESLTRHNGIILMHHRGALGFWR